MSTTTTQQTATVALPLVDLLDALAWVTPASASTNDRNNAFAGVHFTYGPGTEHAPHWNSQWVKVPTERYAVTLAATDRYRLAYSTIEVPTVEGAPEPSASGMFVLDTKELLNAAKVWGKPRKGMPSPLARLVHDVEANTVALSLVDPITDQASSTNVLQVSELPTTNWPKYQRLLPDVDATQPMALVNVNAAFLADFAKSAVKVNRNGSEVVSLAPYHAEKAIPVRPYWNADATVHHSAILMTIRLDR
jgi:hypothetical protein